MSVSPLLVMDSALVILGTGLLLFGGMADGDQIKRDIPLWNAEDLPNVPDTVLAWVDSQPDGSKTEGCGRQEEVLGGRRAVLDPEPLRYGCITAYGDAEGSMEQHLTVSVGLSQRIQRLPPRDGYEVPRLPVGCRGSGHGGFQQSLDVRLLDRFLSVFPNASPGENISDELSRHLLVPK